MSSFLDKLNLKPQERRLLVIVAIVVFVVINIWFVFPVFGELGKTQQRIRDRKFALAQFELEMARETGYQSELAKLEALGYEIPLESQTLAFSREVQDKAVLSGVNLRSSTPGTRGTMLRTNEFFQEQTLVISVANTREKELVNFLYSLGKDNSLTRVSSMMIRPDPSKIYLAGNMTLVKSFQKQASRRGTGSQPKAVTSGATNQPAEAKPAATTPSKPEPKPSTVGTRTSKPPGQPASGGGARTLPRRTLPKPATPK
jgi:hypothetical protein